MRYISTGASVSQLMASGDGSTIVAGLADGSVLRWTVADPHPHLIFRLHGQVTSLAVDRTGSVIAASDSADAELWRYGRTVVRLSVPAGQKAGVVAVSPSGRPVVLCGVLPVERGVPSTFGVESIVIFSVPRMTVMSVHRNPWNSFSWSGADVDQLYRCPFSMTRLSCLALDMGTGNGEPFTAGR